VLRFAKMASLGEKELTSKGVAFTSHEYDYRKKGAEAAAEGLGVNISATVKTLVVKLATGRYVFLCVCGDTKVSMRNFARAVSAKSADLASERDTERLTGYSLGGIGPFGSRTPLDVFIDLSVLDHDRVYINGGRRGLLLGFDPETLIDAANAEVIDVARL
jgi:Cys-tRNA(Pro) deacylase